MKQPEDNLTFDFMDIMVYADGSWSYRYEAPVTPDVVEFHSFGTEGYRQFFFWKEKDKR